MGVDLPHPVGFVLSGGGTGGAIQVGMLRALAESAIRPDIVVGTSAGAINGALVAGRPDDAWQRLDEAWRALHRSSIFPYGLRDLRRLLRNRRHLFPTDGLTALIESHKTVDLLEELTLTFGAVVTDALTGRAVTLTEGPLEPALRASAAIPGVFPRVEIDGRWYWDGGIAANIPIRQAAALGAESLVVLDAGTGGVRGDLPGNIANTFLYVTGVLLRNQVEADLIHLAHLPVVYLPRYVGQAISPFDFGHTDDLIEQGHKSSVAFLADLEIVGPGVYGTPDLSQGP